MAVSRSSFRNTDIPALVEKYFGLRTEVDKQLDSYDDQNFLVHVTQELFRPENISVLNQQGYILKVVNSDDSRKPAIIDAQTEMILHVARQGYPTSAPVLSINHSYSETIGTEEFPHNIRLFEYKPGKRLGDVPLTIALCYDVGYYAGKIDRLLETCSLKEEVMKQLNRKWNLSEVSSLKENVHMLEDQEQQRVITDVIGQFEQRILRCSSSFTSGLIHSDFNDCNILVDQNKNLTLTSKSDTQALPQREADDYCVCGIIDFGDATHSLYLYELAIAVAYLMINRHGFPPLVAAKHAVSGYSRHIQLPDWELRHLRLAVCARFAQSLVLGRISSLKEPWNEYITNDAKRIWPVLKDFWLREDTEMLSALK